MRLHRKEKKSKFRNKSDEIEHLRKSNKTKRILIVLLGLAAIYFMATNITIDPHAIKTSSVLGDNPIIKEYMRNDTLSRYYNVSNLNVSSLYNQTCVTNVDEGNVAVNTMTTAIKLFFEKLYGLPTSFITKLLLFLGLIYLIQVCLSIFGDLLELIIMLFVFIRAVARKLYYKLRPPKDPMVQALIKRKNYKF